MLSTPPAITTSATPVCTIIAAVATACRPLPQRRSSCSPETSIGKPACIATQRPVQGTSPLV